MKKSFILYLFVSIPCLLIAQGTYIPIGSQTNHYLERLEIKTGLVKGFHTSNKPYDRKMVIDYVNGLDSLSDMSTDELTKIDKENIEYLYKDNFEFDDTHVELTESPKLKFLWKHPAHF